VSIEILASKLRILWGLIGVYHRQTDTVLTSKLHFLVSTFLSTMFDVGDLPELTFGN